MRKFANRVIGFCKEVVSEDGRASAKRVSLFLLLFTFIFLCLYNVFTGKMINDNLLTDLFSLLPTIFALVFGSNIISAVKVIKTTGQINNKQTITSDPGDGGADQPPPAPPGPPANPDPNAK